MFKFDKFIEISKKVSRYQLFSYLDICKCFYFYIYNLSHDLFQGI